MHRLFQIICYASTLIAALIIGGALSVFCWQSKAYWQMTLGERPLPLMTEFFQLHWRICSDVVVLPWLAFIGLPVVFPTRNVSFWDNQAFFLRLTTFILVEAAVVLLILASILAPAAGILKALPPSSVSVLDSAVHCIFWALILVLTALAALRIWRRKSRATALPDVT